MVVHRPGSGTCWGLAEEGTGQLRQDVFGESLPQKVPTFLSQGTEHLVEKHQLLEGKHTCRSGRSSALLTSWGDEAFILP